LLKELCGMTVEFSNNECDMDIGIDRRERVEGRCVSRHRIEE
jgi:hypothetical protein